MRKIGLFVCSLLVLPAVASADSFSATFGGAVSGTGVQGTFKDSYGVQKSFNVFAGQLLWETDVDEFLSFCLQLDSPLVPEQEFEASMPTHINVAAANSIARLMSMTNGGAGSAIGNAAIQLAIWNLIYEGDNSVTTGTFRSWSDAAKVADELLLALGSYAGPNGHALFLNSLPGKVGQDQVTYSTPEPGTLLLLGAGALALAARRRMRHTA